MISGMRRQSGFTLTELLITLSILGVIATYTIPKLLATQQSSTYKSAAKEVCAMVAQAYAIYSYKNIPTGATRFSDLTPYMNYLSKKTTGFIDGHELEGNIDCSVTTCLKLHNGGVIRYPTSVSFSGTASTNAMSFNFDPDGELNGRHSVQFLAVF
jgi:prepilin-type N-terminal cleavage/methylation domain-containing protein